MDLQILATVLTGLSVLATGLGVVVALVSHNRTARRDQAQQTERLEQKIDDGISGVRGEVSGLRGEVSGLRGEISDVRGEVSGLRGEISALRADLSTTASDLGARIDRLDTKVDTGLAGVRSDVGDVRGYVHSLEQRFYDFLRPRYAAPTGTDDA